MLPSIPKPKPAHSYNPAFEDWDALLRTEGDKEVAAEQARLAAEAAEVEAQARIKAAAVEPDQDPLLLDEEESAWEGIETEQEESECNAEWLNKKRPERKTKAERNKIKRRKQEEREKKRRDEVKRREQQANKIKEIVADFKSNDTPTKAVGGDDGEPNDCAVEQSIANEEDQEKLASKDDADLRRRNRLGRRALPPKDLELVLPDELQDSLRLLKPEGNLLRGRFRSMQVRGRVEVRKPVHQSKKPQRKTTEKWSYKDFTVVA